MIAGISRERWTRVSELLDRLIELPSVERRGFLDAECHGDEDLRRQLDSLVAAVERPEGVLDTPAFGAAGPMLRRAAGSPPDGESDPASVRVGSTIGPFRLLGAIGSPDAPAWRALEIETSRSEVALRLLRDVDVRFATEALETARPLLARLDHPGIARTLSVVAAADGRGYLAAEFVSGDPIQLHCDQHRLRIRERLELFRQVCDVLHHAHAQRIAHGALRPWSVLVTVSGERPRVKITDFALARVTRLEGGIDVRQDVRDLGVLLHGILVGQPPGRSAPHRPSASLRRGGPEGDAVAASRGTTVRRLIARTRGDLDWIVMRAMARNPAARYAAAGDLRDDIERHLEHEPVDARPRGPMRAWDWLIARR